MIFELLAEGKENARTAREITIQVERERREGRPICAATGSNPGYYLPEDEKELMEYCDQLKGRAIEIFKTRQALVRVLRRISEEGGRA